RLLPGGVGAPQQHLVAEVVAEHGVAPVGVALQRVQLAGDEHHRSPPAAAGARPVMAAATCSARWWGACSVGVVPAMTPTSQSSTVTRAARAVVGSASRAPEAITCIRVRGAA